MNPFCSKKNSKNRTFFFLNMSQRIEPFFLTTQRLEHLLSKKKLKELNHFLNMSQRIELFFWTWLKELNLFFLKRCFFSASWCITSTSAELFTCVVSTLAQTCVQHFSCYWKNSVDSIQAEFSRGLLSQNVSIFPEWCRPHPHGIASFCRAFMRLDQLPFVVMYLCLSQLILSRQALFLPSFIRTVTASLPSLRCPKVEPFISKVTQRLEPLFPKWLQELNPFSNMTPRIEPFFSKMTRRIEPFFSTWLKEIEPL